jgi:hypothetical protein
MDKANIDHCIEVLCHRGCSEVRNIIGVLERGEPLPETEGLNPAECDEVLRALKAIMAVYDRPSDA